MNIIMKGKMMTKFKMLSYIHKDVPKMMMRHSNRKGMFKLVILIR